MFAQTSYRREHRTVPAVPVVMPLVEVAIDADGYLAITLDREPYAADRSLTRVDLPTAVSGIANDLGTPVRLEVRENDGQRFTEILLPKPASAASSGDAAPIERSAKVSVFGINGEGFEAGEEIAVCVVLATQIADPDGATHLRLPPGLVAKRPDVVLIGKRSGCVAASPGPALDDESGAA